MIKFFRVLDPRVLFLFVLPGMVFAQPANMDSYLNDQFSVLSGRGSATTAMKLSQPVKPTRKLTILLTLARQHWKELSPATQALVQPWLYRPTDNNRTDESQWRYTNPEAIPVSTTHYLIHYIDANQYQGDPDATVPTWVSTVASVLEEVWNKEHGDLGYSAVPSDAASSTNGGDGKYDVYLTNLGVYGLFGYVAPEGYSNDTSRPYGAYSYMVLDNDFSKTEYGYDNPQDPLKVTVAHEYFHAIQNGYSYEEDSAFMEQSSTWMEDVVYPTIHDNYNYIGEPYVDANDNGQYDSGETFTDHNGNEKRDEGSAEWPELPLDAFDTVPLIQYGRFLWIRYLEKSFGPVAEREIWERCGAVKGDNTFEAENYALTINGSSLAQAYQEYAEWGNDRVKFQTGDEYPPLAYVDRVVSGSNLVISSLDSPSLKQLKQAKFASQLHLSTIYTYITNPTGSYKFATTQGQSALTMLVDTGSGQPLSHESVTITNGVGTWTASGNEIKVVAVISNVSDSKENLNWTLISDTGAANTAPVIAPIGDKKVNDGSLLTFTVSATDAEGTKPYLEVSGLPPDSTFVSDTGEFNWNKATTGSYNVVFTAYDGADFSLKDTQTILIKVDKKKKSGFGSLDPMFLTLLLVSSVLLLRRRFLVVKYK